MNRILRISLIIFSLLIFLESICYGFAMKIDKPSVEVSAKPGESGSGSIVIENTGKREIGIHVFAEDWLYNVDGTKSFYAAGTMPFSCARWIRIFPSKFNLEAGKTMAVQYTINVPEDASGGYYAVIFFESIPTSEYEEKEAIIVKAVGRVGSIVYLETKGKSTLQGSIESLSITSPQSDKPLEMSVVFKNTGNVHIEANGILNIIDEEGNVYGKKKFGPINTLPGDTRETKLEWFGELEEGSYYAVVTLDIGTDEPIVEERKLDVFLGATISSFSVDTSSERPSFTVVVKNTGHLNIETSGRIDIFSSDGASVDSLNLRKLLIAPGQEKELKGSLGNKLAPGTYTAKAVISIGAKEFVKEEIFSIK